MSVTNSDEQPAFVLAPDARIFTLEELPAGFRRTLNAEPGDVVVDRTRQRRQSHLIGADTASLLEAFRAPATVAEAVLKLSRQEGANPDDLLEAAFPAIKALVEMELLLPAGAETGDAAEPRLKPGDRVGGYLVVRSFRTAEDAEVYQARDKDQRIVAIKIAGAGAKPGKGQRVLEEADILRRLKSLPVPELLDTGTHEGAPYFVMGWIEGVPACMRSDQIRLEDASNQGALLKLCQGIADAYAALHEAGILHGDVRPSNVLVDRDDKVHLLDFGMARSTGGAPARDRLRALEFESLEPEAAEPLSRGEIRPQTEESEQFAVAALLYRLVSGRPFRTPAADQERALEEIMSGETPAPFASGHCEAWPDLESLLHRALARRPGDRFETMRALADALSRVRCGRPIRPASEPGVAAALVEQVIDAACRPDAGPETLFPMAPRASLHGGAAGLGWLLYRAALFRRDGLLLAQADRWARHAVACAGDSGGLVAPANGIDETLARRSSPLHDASGPAAVQCLVAVSRGAERDVESALQGFLSVAAQAPSKRELFLGNAGTLAAAAALHDAASAQDGVDRRALRAWICRCAAETESWIADQRPIGRETALRHLGMAHGWAGVLYGVLQARAVLDERPAETTLARLAELASFATPIGRGLGWVGTATPNGPATPAYAPGWCSGSAGHLYLWLAAFEATGDQRHRQLAEAAGWHVWEHPDREANLCCGLAGRALALLRLYRATGQEVWRERSARLVALGAEVAAARMTADHSLFRGAPGLSLAALELEQPAASCFPLFEPMRWRTL